jgi:hypothetical protein
VKAWGSRTVVIVVVRNRRHVMVRNSITPTASS